MHASVTGACRTRFAQHPGLGQSFGVAMRSANGWFAAAITTSSSCSQGWIARSVVCGPSMKPTSTSKPATAAITSAVLPMRSRTGLPGRACDQRATIAGSRYSPMVKLAATRSGAPCAAPSRPCSSPARSSKACARGSSARPFSLSTRRRPTRSNSAAPSAASRSASALLAADCERATRSAAARVLPARAVATNTASWRSVIRGVCGSAD